MEHFIKNIKITNFKSIRHAEVKDCRRVNVFVGYPNVGKSNILEALGGFSFLSKSNSVDLQESVRFKDLSDLFFNGDTTEFSEISLNESLFLSFVFNSVNTIEIEITNESVEKQRFSSPSHETYYHSEFSDGKHLVNINSVDPKKDKYPFDYWERKDQRFVVKKYSFKNSVDYKASNDKSLVIPFGNNIFDILETNQKVRNDIASYFKIFGQRLLFEKAKRELRILRFLDDETIFTLPFDLVADTLKRLIFYKAAIFSNEKAILLLEEPEAHMFPPYISKMTGDIIYDENNNQFFIATHSPYVLGDLIRDVEPDELSVYIVDYDTAKGETIINRMNEEEVNEAYQFGHDFFMNINNFIPKEQHEQV